MRKISEKGGGDSDEPERKPQEDPETAVEQALLRRALSITVTETRRETTDKGEKTVTTQKELPPDISAQMFWLKNRSPQRWREKPAIPEEAPENNLLEILRQIAEEAE